MKTWKGQLCNSQAWSVYFEIGICGSVEVTGRSETAINQTSSCNICLQKVIVVINQNKPWKCHYQRVINFRSELFKMKNSCNMSVCFRVLARIWCVRWSIGSRGPWWPTDSWESGRLCLKPNDNQTTAYGTRQKNTRQWDERHEHYKGMLMAFLSLSLVDHRGVRTEITKHTRCNAVSKTVWNKTLCMITCWLYSRIISFTIKTKEQGCTNTIGPGDAWLIRKFLEISVFCRAQSGAMSAKFLIGPTRYRFWGPLEKFCCCFCFFHASTHHNFPEFGIFYVSRGFNM